MMDSAEDHEANMPNRRQRVMLALPDEFLRIPVPPGSIPPDEASNETRIRSQSQDAVYAAQMAAMGHQVARPTAVRQGRLSVTIAQAKLGKNYGLARMDPYARIRIGHYVFETDTDTNGATNPRWDKTFTCYVPPGINSVYVEVFDERTFGTDERIGWGQFTIPSRVFEGDALDDWFPLSGKQGDQKEGMIEIVFSYEMVTTTQMIPPNYVMMANPPHLRALPMAPRPGMPPYGAVLPPGAMGIPPQTAVMAVQITEEDVKQIKEMFPNVDDEVIRSVLEEKNGHKQAAINALLSITEG